MTDVNNSATDTNVDVVITDQDVQDHLTNQTQEEKDKIAAQEKETQENTETTENEKSIQEILKDCNSFDELFNNEKVSAIIEKLLTEKTQALSDEIAKREKKNTELMDELKPLKAKLRNDEYMKMFNEGDVEGMLKKAEEDTASIYKEINSQEVAKSTKLINELTSERNTLAENVVKLKDNIKDSHLEKFFNGKDIDKTALLDAIKFAKEDFDIDDEINFKHKTVQEYTIENWLETQRTKRPYLFVKFNPTGVSHNNRINQGKEKAKINDLKIEDYKKARAKQDGLK